MKQLGAWTIAVGITVLVQFSSPVLATEDNEMIAERIHSTLPLYTFDWEQTWPRSFTSGDDFGCTSRVAFGDWHFTPNPNNDFAEERWERFTNYGAFHCGAIMRIADEQADLGSGPINRIPKAACM